jgi:hypothetical protein
LCRGATAKAPSIDGSGKDTKEEARGQTSVSERQNQIACIVFDCHQAVIPPFLDILSGQGESDGRTLALGKMSADNGEMCFLTPFGRHPRGLRTAMHGV